MEGRKRIGALSSIWRNNAMSTEAKLGLFKGVVVPTVMYGCEARTLQARDTQRIEALEMKSLRMVRGVA